MKGKKKRATCTYCYKRRVLGRDHVPPKTLFPRPRPANLITVPACTACNTRASKDDEYFRDVVSLRDDANTPAAKLVRETAINSLYRPQRAGFRRSFLKNVASQDVFSAAGIFLGKKIAYTVDSRRLDRVIRRVTRGLHLHHHGQRLPARYSVWARTLSAIEPEPQAMLAVQKMAEAARQGRRWDIGQGVFSYWHAVAADDPRGALWFYVFYESICFMAITTPSTA